MPKAIWNQQVIAESSQFVEHEGHIYFPLASVRREYFIDSEYTTVCPRKGPAQYFTLQVDGQENPNAAWTYASQSPQARRIAGHVAFWKGVTVRE